MSHLPSMSTSGCTALPPQWVISLHTSAHTTSAHSWSSCPPHNIAPICNHCSERTHRNQEGKHSLENTQFRGHRTREEHTVEKCMVWWYLFQDNDKGDFQNQSKTLEPIIIWGHFWFRRTFKNLVIISSWIGLILESILNPQLELITTA